MEATGDRRGTRDVVFLGHSAEPSGAEISLMRLESELRTGHHGVAPRVVLLDEGEVADILRRSGASVEVRRSGGSSARIGGPVGGQVRGAADLAVAGVWLGRSLRRRRPDALVAETLKALVVGAVASRVAGIPLIWHAHDRPTVEYLGLPAHLAIRVLARICVRGVVANSGSTRSTIPRVRGPVAVVYPGVAPDRALARTGEGEVEGDGDDRVTIVLVGRIDTWKGHRVLFDAVREMERPPHRLVVVGGPLFGREELLSDLRRAAADLPAGVDVEFTGHVDDPRPHMAAADVLVHCSTLPEPFGQVVVEGMQQGCAVVAARAGGPVEIVTDGVDGLLHTPGDHADLASALDRLSADPALRRRLAAAGRRRATEFEVPEQARRFVDLLERVVEPVTRRRPHRALRGR